MNDKPRAATVFVRSEQAVLLVLSKKDYIKVLGDSDKQKIELAIANVQQFDIFKQFTKIKMRNLYYYFKDLNLKRDRYLFRQGDPINGVFCILSGEVKLVTE